MNRKSLTQIGIAFLVSIALGLLEASWTTPSAPGATRPMLGSFAIGIVLAAVCWRRLWWVPALSMLEEIVQIFFGQLPPVRPSVYNALFHHWSASFTCVNLYPYITFPLIGIAGETLYQYLRKTKRHDT